MVGIDNLKVLLSMVALLSALISALFGKLTVIFLLGFTSWRILEAAASSVTKLDV